MSGEPARRKPAKHPRRGARAKYRIEVADEQEVLAVDRKLLVATARETLRLEEVAAAEISIALVDDAAMQALNVRHLAHDYPTDVLSFLLEQSGGEESSGPPRGRGKRIEGEVVISVETAVREAGGFGWEAIDELRLYLVHGLLHLCGYDDHGAAARAEMRAREEKVLARFGVEPRR